MQMTVSYQDLRPLFFGWKDFQFCHQIKVRNDVFLTLF